MPGANQHQPAQPHIVNIGHVTNTDKSHGGVTSGKRKGGSGTLNQRPIRRRKGGK